MSKTIYELSDEVLGKLEDLGHSKLTRDNFRYFWNGMARYFESNGVCEFDINVAMEYFEMRCSKHNFKKRSENFIKRAILILDHYSKHGTIPLRCYTPISKLNNLELIKLLSSYGESLVAGEYSSRTIEGYLRYASCFLQFAEQNECYEPDDWSAETIFEYISTLSSFQKATIKHRVGGLRLFLKYLYFNGLTKENSSAYAGTVRGTYHQKIPSIWTKNEVNQMLNAIDRNNPNEKRDYAMLLLVARLGLRSSDIKKLKFENFNWTKNEITLNQSKTGEPLTLPLLRDVGWAIIDYVQNARPKTDNPHIFLKH
ncbi:MAG: tyrosine-type recombinase/integrase, partial [Oscillospiraceae bacterium]